MFNFVEQTNRFDLAKKAVMFLVSTALHLAAIVVLILLPLIFIGAVPEVDLLSFLIAAPVPPPAPAPPTPPVAEKRIAAAPREEIKEFRLPERIPDGIVPPAPGPVEGIVPLGPTDGIPGGGVGGFGGILGSPLGTRVLETPAPPPTPPPPPRPKKADPVRRGGDVQSSKLIVRIDPVYPPIAIQARVSGKVIMDVRVDEEGNVENIRVLEGHPLLVDAARNAVAQWKYSPTILNGEPVPVLATVTVIFTLR